MHTHTHTHTKPHTPRFTRSCFITHLVTPMTITRYVAMFGYIYYLCVYMGDAERGHCQGACRSQWFFYVPFQVSETAPPFTRSCEPREIHSLQCWRARKKSAQAYPAHTEDWTRAAAWTGAQATTCAVATLGPGGLEGCKSASGSYTISCDDGLNLFL